MKQTREAARQHLQKRPSASRRSILLVVRHPVGGIRTFLRYVLSHLDPQWYRFTLVAPECPEARALLDDLQRFDLNYRPLAQGVSTKAFIAAVTGMIRATRYDVVYSQGFTSGVSSVIGSLTARTPHLLTCHDVFNDAQFLGLKGFLKRSILGATLATIDRIHCVGDDARSNVLFYLPILRLFRRKVLGIRNGIETERFLRADARNFRRELGLEPDCFLIGFLGRFMSQKGFRYLVDALVEMRKRSDLPRRPIVLTVSAQDGFYREEMGEIERRGLSDAVYFLPFVPNVASTLKGLDVVAIPSLWEACPLLPMEAMVAGVPVVGTNCVGLREVLADTPAKIVPPRDALALANALIAEMLESTTIQAEEFAPIAAARFTVEKQAEAIERLISELLEQRVRTIS